MKKTLSCMLIICLLIPFCFASCKKKETGGFSSITSSDIPYTETTSEIAKTEEGGEFTFAFDPYVLPRDVKKELGTITHYKNFVNAVIARQSSVSMPSRDEYDMIRFAIGENFPYSALISGYRYDSATNSILISYEYNSSHNDKISQFKSAVQEVFDACVKNTDDDTLAAISLYSYLVQNIEIIETKPAENPSDNAESSDIAIDETSSESDSEGQTIMADIYTTLIDKEGTASSVASLYNFLLMQLGIDCKTVSSWNAKTYKTWNMIELDSKWYHCDIPAEQKEADGEGLKFFGMTEEKASLNVNGNEIYTGQWTWFSKDLPKAKSNRFEEFDKIVSWEINTDRDGILAYTDEFSRFSWNIND